MMKKNERSGKLLKRGLSVLFAFLMVFSALVFSPMKASAGADKVKVYHWKLATSRDDVRDGPIVLTWKSNNVTYFTGKGLTGLKASDYPTFDFAATDFYTMPDVPCWRMERCKDRDLKPQDDGDNANAPYVRLYDGNNCNMFYSDGLKTLDKAGTYPNLSSSSEETRFTVGTHGSKKYDSDTQSNCMRFIFNISNADPQLVINGSTLTTERSTTYSKASNFRVYIADVEEFSAIDSDLTVESGSVFQIKGDTVLTDGHTITVKPGGVLSVEGTFYNDGYISNEGTFLIHENAFVSMMDPNALGSIACKSTGPDSEGSLIIMENAVLLGGEIANFQFVDADVVCRGLMVLPNGLKMKNTIVTRQGNGVMLLGYTFKAGTTGPRTLSKLLLSSYSRAAVLRESVQTVPAANLSVFGSCALLNFDTDNLCASFPIPDGTTENGTLRRSYD